jgi:hypothetical protein
MDGLDRLCSVVLLVCRSRESRVYMRLYRAYCFYYYGERTGAHGPGYAP